MISKGTLAYLSFYCEYQGLLRSVVAEKRRGRDRSPFLEQFSRAHSLEPVSQLCSALISKDCQITRLTKLFRQECLHDYFELEQVRPERLVPTLVKRIVEAKAGGAIEFEEEPRRKKVTRFLLEEKENKAKSWQVGLARSCKIGSFHQTELYFSLLALKLLLKEQQPNTQQVSKLCQDIKLLFRNLLAAIRLKPTASDHSGKLRSILRPNQ